MKLFYQLSQDEQDAAIEHCADLVASNALEKGLRIEVADDEAGQELKERLDGMLEELEDRKDLKTREQKIKFLMEDQSFADTIFEFASEMAHSSFYHSDDELTITLSSLAERVQKNNDEDDDDDDDEGDEDEPAPRTEPTTVDELVKGHQLALKKHSLN